MNLIILIKVENEDKLLTLFWCERKWLFWLHIFIKRVANSCARDYLYVVGLDRIIDSMRSVLIIKDPIRSCNCIINIWKLVRMRSWSKVIKSVSVLPISKITNKFETFVFEMTWLWQYTQHSLDLKHILTLVLTAKATISAILV